MLFLFSFFFFLFLFFFRSNNTTRTHALVLQETVPYQGHRFAPPSVPDLFGAVLPRLSFHVEVTHMLLRGKRREKSVRSDRISPTTRRTATTGPSPRVSRTFTDDYVTSHDDNSTERNPHVTRNSRSGSTISFFGSAPDTHAERDCATTRRPPGSPETTGGLSQQIRVSRSTDHDDPVILAGIHISAPGREPPPDFVRPQDALRLVFRRVRRTRATGIMLPFLSVFLGICVTFSPRTPGLAGSARARDACRARAYHASPMSVYKISMFLVTERVARRAVAREQKPRPFDHTRCSSLRTRFVVVSRRVPLQTIF